VHQDERRVEHDLRLDSGLWEARGETAVNGALDLPSLACALTLDEIYYRLEG
jgi:hypothetical protein